MKLNDLGREDLMQAITEGVRQAFTAALTGIDLAEAVKEGVDSAFYADTTGAIKEGIVDAFPFAELILAAIADGTKEAMERR